MARNQPISMFGVHGCTPYSRTTGLPYGELRVVEGSSLSMSGTQADLMGGSSKYPWASEEGAITAELSLKIGEIPDFIYELFLGNAPTQLGAQSAGSISTLTNKYGTSIQNAANGMSSVSVLTGSSSNLKFGHYAVKAVTSSSFHVYYLTSIDLGRGVDGTILTDDMLVGSAIVFTTAVGSIPSFGLQFNSVGTPAFTVGDTATFEVAAVNGSSSSVIIGGVTASSFPEFGALLYSQKRGNQEMFEFDCYRLKAAGMPIPLEMGAWAKYDLKAKLLHDEARDGIFKMTRISPV